MSDQLTRLVEGDWLPEDADIVKFETTKRLVEVHGRRFYSSIGRHLGRLASRHMGAAGYIVTRRAAERLLESTERPPDAVDHALFRPEAWDALELKVYQMDPAPIVQGMYEGSAVGHDWAVSNLQNSRDKRGYVMEIEDHRLFGRPKKFSQFFRMRSFVHGFKMLRSLAKGGAYKRIPFE